jgi:signal transduction histidine kinase
LIFRKYNIYLERKEYGKAKEFLINLVKNGSLGAEANNRRTLYSQLAKTTELMGDMKEAYHWSTLYGQLSDSLHGVQLKERIADLEAKFQHSENQKKITALQEEKARIELSARNGRLFNWLLSTICLLLLGLVGFSWFFVRNQKKLQQLKVTRAMLEGEERERKRIAQDLHDGLGGMLAGVKINLSGWAAGKLDPPQDMELHKIIGQLDRSVGELRHIARNMMPETLLKFGLETALKDLCEFYMREDIHIEFQSFNIPGSLPLAMQINIYRIVQEILANAVRHANATNIILQCSQNESVFFITIEDNGKGFDQAALKGKSGLGLLNVKSRVDYMKGKMEIVSGSGEGTTINIELSTYAEQ